MSKSRKNGNSQKNLTIKDINPKTKNQQKLWNNFEKTDHLFITGCAGTGKTFCLLYLALKRLQRDKTLDKIIIVRSAVPTRDQGFLPGNLQEKTSVYEEPYRAIINDLYSRGDAYDILKSKTAIEFTTTSYLRGVNIDNSIVIIDEAQNLHFGELDTIITRIGINSHLYLIGDINQNDLTYSKQKHESGLTSIREILENLPKTLVEFVSFEPNDIVRSGFVKEFIKSKISLNY